MHNDYRGLGAHLASRGRNGDDTMVHMSWREVNALQGLGHSYGVHLTTNPDTGLPEAFNFLKILPFIIGAAAIAATAGAAAAPIGASTAAAAVPAATAVPALTAATTAATAPTAAALTGATTAANVGSGIAAGTADLATMPAVAGSGVTMGGATTSANLLGTADAAAAGNTSMAALTDPLTAQSAQMASNVNQVAPYISSAPEMPATTTMQDIGSGVKDALSWAKDNPLTTAAGLNMASSAFAGGPKEWKDDYNPDDHPVQRPGAGDTGRYNAAPISPDGMYAPRYVTDNSPNGGAMTMPFNVGTRPDNQRNMVFANGGKVNQGGDNSVPATQGSYGYSNTGVTQGSTNPISSMFQAIAGRMNQPSQRQARDHRNNPTPTPAPAAAPQQPLSFYVGGLSNQGTPFTPASFQTPQTAPWGQGLGAQSYAPPNMTPPGVSDTQRLPQGFAQGGPISPGYSPVGLPEVTQPAPMGVPTSTPINSMPTMAPMPPAAPPQGQDPAQGGMEGGSSALIALTAKALRGELPGPQSKQIIQAFVQKYGQGALQHMMQMVSDSQGADAADPMARQLPAGGGAIGGEDDGHADTVPAMIDGQQPAALSSGEHVIPADAVAHFGNGNTAAGHRKIKSAVNRARMAKTGSSGMPDPIGDIGI